MVCTRCHNGRRQASNKKPSEAIALKALKSGHFRLGHGFYNPLFLFLVIPTGFEPVLPA